MSADIFLSYASTDRDRVRPLVQALKRRGWSVWWDRDLVPGASFPDRIEDALAAARCAVVVWTEASVNSEWVHAEAMEGLARRILVPVMLDKVSLPLAFRHQDAAQLLGWKGDDGHPEFQRLVGAVEQTLSGVRQAAGDRPVRAQPPAWWSRFALPGVVALILSVVLGVGASLWLARRSPEAIEVAPPNSIAVLPLTNLGTGADAYRSEGLSLEILSLLSRIKELVVASPTSSFTLRGTTADIGRQLGVRYFVEGNVNRSDADLVVDVRLVDAATRHVLWSDRLTRSADALPDIPLLVARGVVATVDVQLSEESLRQLQSKPTSNPAALDSYLRGTDVLRGPIEAQTLDAAERAFREAIALDGAYAMPYAGLCRVYLMRYQVTLDATDFSEAEDNCRRTLSLNALQADPHKALGGLYLASGRTDEAEVEYERARRLARRDGEAVIGLADVADRRDDTVKAEQLFREAIALEPLYWRTHASLGRFLFGHARYADAAAAFQRAIDLDPGHASTYESLGAAYYMNGAIEEALAVWQKGLAVTPGATAYSNVGTAEFMLRRFGNAVTMYQKAIELAPKDHRWWGHLGDARRLSGQQIEARAAYDKAAELARENLVVDKDDAETRIRLALYDAQLGRADLARMSLDEALRLTPNDPYLYYDAAVAYATMGMTAQALEALGNAVKRGYPTHLVAADPQFDALQATDGFRQIVR